MKHGQWVWTVQAGWGKLEKRNSTEIPYKVRGRYYNAERKHEPEDFHASLFELNPFDDKDLPPIDIKVGEIVAVRDCEEFGWIFAPFERQLKNGVKVFNFDIPFNFFRALGDIEKGC